MKNRVLTTVSVMVLSIATPVWAENNNIDVPDVPKVSKEDVKEAWKEAKGVAKEAAENVSHAADDLYGTVRSALFGDEIESGIYITVDRKKTAEGMIGQEIRDTKDSVVAKVHDIILNEDGEAKTIVLSEGGLMGLGDKLIGFDYGLMVHKDKQGDIIMPVTKQSLDKALPYSYDGDSSMPKSGYSVRDIMGGRIVDKDSNTLAYVDNLTFRGGEAGHLIVSFDQTLGVGGETAAFEYDSVEIVKDVKAVNFRMNPIQENLFRDFKRKAIN